MAPRSSLKSKINDASVGARAQQHPRLGPPQTARMRAAVFAAHDAAGLLSCPPIRIAAALVGLANEPAQVNDRLALRPKLDGTNRADKMASLGGPLVADALRVALVTSRDEPLIPFGDRAAGSYVRLGALHLAKHPGLAPPGRRTCARRLEGV